MTLVTTTLSIITLSTMKLSIAAHHNDTQQITHSTMLLSINALSIRALEITTLRLMILIQMILSITILSIMTLITIIPSIIHTAQ